MMYKNSGAVDGDAFREYVEFSKEIENSLPTKCIIDDGWTGVCIITYKLKEKFVYHKKIYHIFKTRKDGVMIAYQVDVRTGRKKQINKKVAMRRHKAQLRREKKSKKKLAEAKKQVIKQYQRYAGCRSTDVKYIM